MDIQSPIIFSKHHSKLIVGVLDIVDSTKLTSTLSGDEVDVFYTIFLEEFTRAIFQREGIVIKNIGDGLLFYFATDDEQVGASVTTAIQAAQALLDLRSDLNKKLIAHGLPMIGYRISMSYGPVSAMINSDGRIVDIFGATVSTCAKFNKYAKPNTLIIGEALSEHVDTRLFHPAMIDRYQLQKDFSFPLYEVGV